MSGKKWLPERAIAKLIASLVIFILLIIFAIQNFQKHSTITILFWEIVETPISIIIFVSILIGALISVCAILPHILRLQRRVRRSEKEAVRIPTMPPKSDKHKEPQINAD